MHIPDGYLSPPTYLGAYAAMIPVWAVVSKRLGGTLRARRIPLLAMGAAFCFVLMMFNIPLPGGTSGHAVGAVLLAILLGPAAACLAVTVVLVIQALLFGDGGITAIGANSLNMAFVMPFVGYGVYRLLTLGGPVGAKRRVIAAGVAGYVGLNAAALATAVLFGIQPLIAHDAAGKALYAPYPLRIAIPAMMIPHLLVVGWVEAIVTALAVGYLQRTEPELLTGEEAPR